MFDKRKKVFLGVIISILLVFLIIVFKLNSTLAVEKDINIETTINSNIVAFTITTDYDDIYGFVSSIKYNNSELNFIECNTSANNELSYNDDIFLVETLQPSKDDYLLQCSFEVLEDTKTSEIVLSDVSISDSDGMILVPDKTLSISVDSVGSMNVVVDSDNIVENPKTASSFRYIIIALIISVLLVVLSIFINKKYGVKAIVLLIFVTFIPIVYGDKIKTIESLNASVEDYNIIKDILLKKVEITKEYLDNYDYDEDDIISIYDYILSKVDINMPKIEFVGEETTGSASYYTDVIRDISYDSISDVSSIMYCISTDGECTPNINYALNSEKQVLIQYPSAKESQNICLKVVNSFGLETTICDTKKYKVDSVEPVISFVKDEVDITDSNYDPLVNIKSTCGVSGCNVSCDKSSFSLGTSNVKCTISSNNGLSHSVDFDVNLTEKNEEEDDDYGEDGTSGVEGTYYAPLQGVSYLISPLDPTTTLGCSGGSVKVYHDVLQIDESISKDTIDSLISQAQGMSTAELLVFASQYKSYVKEGAPIYAGMDGTAKFYQSYCATDDNKLYSYGNVVELTSGTTTIIYAHLQKFTDVIDSSNMLTVTCDKDALYPCSASTCTSMQTNVIASNVSIKKGQLIGYLGDTGNSPVPHLHVEIKENGYCVANPWKAFGMTD